MAYTTYVTSAVFRPYLHKTEQQAFSTTIVTTRGPNISTVTYSVTQQAEFARYSGSSFFHDTQFSTYYTDYTTILHSLSGESNLELAGNSGSYFANEKNNYNLYLPYTAYNEIGQTLDNISFTLFSNAEFSIIGGRTEFFNDSSTSKTLSAPSLLSMALCTTTNTSIETYFRKTYSTEDTYYGPLDGSSFTYSRMYSNNEYTTIYSIKSIITTDYMLYLDAGEVSVSKIMEWTGYEGSGKQFIGLAYTTLTENGDISEYAKVFMETDSYSSTAKLEVISFSTGSYGNVATDTYTLTYNIFTSESIESTTTLLQRSSILNINNFEYGFINTSTQSIEITTISKTTKTEEITSVSQGYVYIASDGDITSKISYSYMQTIATTSNFITYIEIPILNQVTSFDITQLTSTTASFIYKSNAYFYNPDSYKTFYPAPIFRVTNLMLYYDPFQDLKTFYTEKAIFGSFAEPSYSSVYKSYSPAECSLVLLALLPLNDTAEEGKYPSHISVYNGSFLLSNDRATESIENVTFTQSSSYVSSGATNVFQTKSYFIDNNTQSLTTESTQINVRLNDVASSFSRSMRYAVENLDSAYINSYLPSLKIVASNILYTNGLQGSASYDVDGLLLNAYTTLRSTFANSSVSSFPASESLMPSPFVKNKISIASSYNADVFDFGFNTFEIGLARYFNYYTG